MLVHEDVNQARWGSRHADPRGQNSRGIGDSAAGLSHGKNGSVSGRKADTNHGGARRDSCLAGCNVYRRPTVLVIQFGDSGGTMRIFLRVRIPPDFDAPLGIYWDALHYWVIGLQDQHVLVGTHRGAGIVATIARLVAVHEDTG